MCHSLCSISAVFIIWKHGQRCKAPTQIGLSQLTSKFCFHPLKTGGGYRVLTGIRSFQNKRLPMYALNVQTHVTIYRHEQRISHKVENWISLLTVQAADSSEEIQMHLHGVNLCKHVLHSSKEINVKVSLASDKKRMSHMSPVSFRRCYLSPSSVL